MVLMFNESLFTSLILLFTHAVIPNLYDLLSCFKHKTEDKTYLEKCPDYSFAYNGSEWSYSSSTCIL